MVCTQDAVQVGPRCPKERSLDVLHTGAPLKARAQVGGGAGARALATGRATRAMSLYPPVPRIRGRTKPRGTFATGLIVPFTMIVSPRLPYVMLRGLGL
jgi:hypothetical protein